MLGERQWSIGERYMSYEPNAHQKQIAILRQLLFVPQATFAELQKGTGLMSDPFAFHIKKRLPADISYKLLYHKRDFAKQTGKLLEDKLFLCMHAARAV